MVPSEGYILLFYACYATASIFVTNRFMIETKDKKEAEINEEYRQLDEVIWGF